MWVVVKVVKRVLVFVDMFFGSYEVSVEEGVKNVMRLIWVGVDVVKIEGGYDYKKFVKKFVCMGILVMGYMGFIL